jgi:parallel beta-helix repeat protein
MVDRSMKMVERKKNNIIHAICIFFLINLSIQPLLALSNQDQDTLFLINVNPNQDIQKVVNQAPVNATIVFQEGVYSQSFRISKPLKLIGSGLNETIMSIRTIPNNPAITISSDFVTLSNFTIMNTASGLYTTAIRIDASKVQVSNCYISNTPIGIAVWNNQVKITNSTFTNCSDEGILLITTSISTSDNNMIKECNFFNNCDGIELQHSSNNIISRCIFKGNSHAGIDAICDNNNNNTIYNCIFSNNDAFDIYFSSSEHNRISQCSLQNDECSVVFSPSISTNIIKIQSPSSSDIHVEQLKNTGTNDKSLSKLQIVESFLSRSYDLIKSILEEFQSRIQKRQ